jgi:hypothetical protein
MWDAITSVFAEGTRPPPDQAGASFGEEVFYLTITIFLVSAKLPAWSR